MTRTRTNTVVRAGAIAARAAATAVVLAVLVAGTSQSQNVADAPSATEGHDVMSFHDLDTRTLSGEEVSLGSWAGKVALVVNVASKCGNTPQYAKLQALYEELREDGLVVLGFPSNDFRGQEPGTAEEIAEFCRVNYGVTFPLFEKRHVVGEKKDPVYAFLTRELPEPTWNFTKYLVGRDGRVRNRFDPKTPPDDPALVAEIREALAAPVIGADAHTD